MSETMTELAQFKMCPKFEKTFSILGKKWNGLIIESLLAQGDLRFKDIASSIDKCSDRMLVERLKELEEAGIVTRDASENSTLIEYRLTDKGRDMNDMMTTIHEWSDKWSGPEC
ncbi:winged helix-turn-helix transcriptional regulator [Furfurilactobacillus sp. WILCCON 0119]|uniref:winged helix-turn-helix transcriptional regulator n=1 Tax=Furfurilactobacillus entadae TaxID=2922307 RepID=UPI0035EBDEF3